MKQKLMGAVAVAGLLVASLATVAVSQDRGPDADRGPAGLGGGLPAFAELDANGDGGVTLAEVQAWRTARVTALDANADGLVSADEIKAAEMAKAETRAEAQAQRMIARHDANGDGLLSGAEMATPPLPERLFERVDADGDGAVTQAEADAAREEMRKRDRRGGPRGGRHAGHDHDMPPPPPPPPGEEPPPEGN